jgi:hypothetical protein
LDTTTLSDGLYTIRVTALDKAGNDESTSVSFMLDKTPPIVTIAYPTNGSYISISTVCINGTIAEHNKGSMSPSINDIRFSLTYWDAVTGAFEFRNTSCISDGSSLTIMVSFTDLAGNIGSQLTSFTLDATPSRITITYPTNGSYIRGPTIWVNGTVAELYKGTLRPFTNDTRLSLAYWDSLTGDFAFWNNTAIPDDSLSVTMSFIDLAGNSIAETVTVIVDNTKPSVSIRSPEDGAELFGEVNINFTATDINEVELAQLIIDDNMVFNVTGETHLWDTTGVGDGAHTMRLVAYDIAGNRNETAITVTTINVKREIEATRTLYLAIGTPIGVAIGAIIVYAITKKPTGSPPKKLPKETS